MFLQNWSYKPLLFFGKICVKEKSFSVGGENNKFLTLISAEVSSPENFLLI